MLVPTISALHYFPLVFAISNAIANHAITLLRGLSHPSRNMMGSSLAGALTSKPPTVEEDAPLATAPKNCVEQGMTDEGGSGSVWCLQQMAGEGWTTM